MKTIKELRKFFNELDSNYDDVPIHVVREKTKFMFDNDISLVLSTRKGRFDGNVTNETFLLIN